MKELRAQHRWVPWGIATVLCILYLPLAYAVVQAIRFPGVGGEGIRIFIPLFAIFSYWILAIAANSRKATVKPTGVSVTLFPFPTGSGKSIARKDIAVCYARHIVNSDDGVETDNFYTMGVETPRGLQVDLYSPFPTANEALHAANDAVRVLNANPNEPRIEVRMVARSHSDPDYRRQVLVWFGLSILAVLVGAIWEIKSGTL